MTEPIAKAAALNTAQRARMYRQRRQAEGMATLKCHLSPHAMTTLRTLCEIHQRPMGELLDMVLHHAIRGEVLPARP